jgi:hypothetical protein
LKRAEQAGFPPDLIDFYRKHEPDSERGFIEFDHRIYSIQRALKENRGAPPGSELFGHGFVIFAGNASGDVFCLDTLVTTERKLHPIVRFRQEEIEQSTDILHLWERRVEVAESLDDFLVRVAEQRLGPDTSREQSERFETALAAARRALAAGRHVKRTGLQALKFVLSRVPAGRIRPATLKDLKRAERAGFPRELVEFYRKYEPHPKDSCVQLDHRLWCIEGALRENQDSLPGNASAQAFQHGYIAFASSFSGDVYCMDTNVKTERGKRPIVMFLFDDDWAPGYDLQAKRVEVASSLDDFLFQFAVGTLIDCYDMLHENE